jgi:hypothetical protein
VFASQVLHWRTTLDANSVVRLLFHCRNLQYQVVLILRGGGTSLLMREGRMRPRLRALYIHERNQAKHNAPRSLGLHAFALSLAALLMIITMCMMR